MCVSTRINRIDQEESYAFVTPLIFRYSVAVRKKIYHFLYYHLTFLQLNDRIKELEGTKTELEHQQKTLKDNLDEEKRKVSNEDSLLIHVQKHSKPFCIHLIKFNSSFFNDFVTSISIKKIRQK